MGRCICFRGKFTLERELQDRHFRYLRRFSEVRHDLYRVEALEAYPDPVREEVGLPLGPYGIYCTTSAMDPFALGDDLLAGKLAHTNEHLIERQRFRWQLRTEEAPSSWSTQPLLRTVRTATWCDWRPTDDKKGMEVKDVDKSRLYVEWLQVVIDQFLRPWEYELSGQVEYTDEWGQTGFLVVEQHQVREIITRPANPH